MCLYSGLIFVFFFKQKTAYEMRISDWSSDVCSSDLDRDRARILELLRGDRIVDAIDHRQESLLREHLGRRERFAHVRIERLRFAQHLELHEVPSARLAREPQGADRVVGVEAARDRKSTRLNSSH